MVGEPCGVGASGVVRAAIAACVSQRSDPSAHRRRTRGARAAGHASGRAPRAGTAPGGLPLKTLVSWSSGKDSAWMVHVLRRTPGVEIAGLLTTVNAAAGRVAMHAVRQELLDAQARVLGLPLRVVPIPSPCPNDEYERVMGEAVRAAVVDGFTHVAFGDLFLEDIRRYREEKLVGSGLAPLFPLFGADTARLAREMIAG